MAKNNNLTDFLTNLANKFRSVLGTSETINPQNFEGLIDTTYTKGYNDAPRGTDVSDTTATQADVLTGEYFYNSSGTKVQGTMANNGALGTTTLTASNSSTSIPAGYTSGGTVKINTTNLSAGSIKDGTSILGVTGVYSNLKHIVSGNFQPTSAVTSYTLSNLSLGGLTPKLIILCTNASANWRTSTEYIISGAYVNMGSSTSLSKVVCSKFYSNYVRSYGSSNGNSYLAFSPTANGVTITTSNNAQLTSAKSYFYIIGA